MHSSHPFLPCPGFEESRQNRVKLQEMDPTALEALVDYIYSAEIRVTEGNVQVGTTLASGPVPGL